ncbi:MAG: ATPase, partial [Lachnospiraceae bacterium]|nr:ATPase [Lachnospiraceae bacterium]
MKLTERELEQAVLGIEFGSTRIKGILIDEKGTVITGGSFTWENEWKDGIWTYSLDLAVHGLQCVYREIAENVRSEYGLPIRRLAGIGISAMMHGRLLLGENDRQLAPFATWRNQISKQASEILTERFNYHVSERYSAALLYQAILDGEPYVHEIRKALVLSSYIHDRLTGQNVVGPNEASGMFPVDPATLQYDSGKLEIFRELVR